MKSYRELYDEKKNKKTKCGRNQCRKESGKDRQTIKEYAKKQTKIQKKQKDFKENNNWTRKNGLAFWFTGTCHGTLPDYYLMC